MFEDADELKEFLLWAKEQKILKVKVKDVEVEFSAFAFIDEQTGASTSSATPPALSEATADKPTRIQDDPDLFHSVL